MTERVAGEHLGAEHDEIADQAARERDRGAGEQRVAEELVGEHQPAACSAALRRRKSAGWLIAARASRVIT